MKHCRLEEKVFEDNRIRTAAGSLERHGEQRIHNEGRHCVLEGRRIPGGRQGREPGSPGQKTRKLLLT